MYCVRKGSYRRSRCSSPKPRDNTGLALVPIELGLVVLMHLPYLGSQKMFIKHGPNEWLRTVAKKGTKP